MSPPPRVASTVGVIARRYGVPLHRVEYVVRSRGIRPISRAGNTRIFSDAAVELIGSELQRIDGERDADSYLRAAHEEHAE